MSYTVIYEEASEGGYVVSVPSLPDCHTQGDIKEAEKNIKEAIGVYLESLQAEKESIPEEGKLLHGKVEVRYVFS